MTRDEAIAEIRRSCKRGDHTLWTDARWYEGVTLAEVQAIVSEYGYGPLRSTRTGRPSLNRPDTRPWSEAESVDLPDEPTDGELRTAVRVLRMGGAVGGSQLWCAACARFLGKLGPDDGEDAAAAYKRVTRLIEANKPALSGAIPRATVR